MANDDPEKATGDRAARFGRTAGHKAARKQRARSGADESVWSWFGMMGLVGWSVSVPALIGVAVGRWLDGRWPGRVSWTLTLLLLGVGAGCLSAWYWVDRESRRK